jgi:hypothetical protein
MSSPNDSVSQDGPPRASEASADSIQTPSLTLLEREDVRALLEQACPTAEAGDLDGVADVIVKSPCVYLARWPAGDRPAVQMDEWHEATAPPVKIDNARVAQFTEDHFQWGPFHTGAMLSKFDTDYLGEILPLPPEKGGEETVNRVILYCWAPAELIEP